MLPGRTCAEFIDYAKKNPDMITVSTPGRAAGVHLVALAFEHAAGIKLNHIPFSGGGPSVTAAGWACQRRFGDPARRVAQIKAGQLKILALFADKRWPCSRMYPRSGNRDQLLHGHVAGLAAPRDRRYGQAQQSFRRQWTTGIPAEGQRHVRDSVLFPGRKTSVRSWSGTMNFREADQEMKK
jgi:hypothetical protein